MDNTDSVAVKGAKADLVPLSGTYQMPRGQDHHLWMELCAARRRVAELEQQLAGCRCGRQPTDDDRDAYTECGLARLRKEQDLCT